MIGDDDLRDCFAMFAMLGLVMRNESWNPKQPWEIADDMMEARKQKEKENEEDIGIVAVVPKRTRKR